jgi:hypothetical protein
MDTSLQDLMRQYRSAARKLVIMEEYGSSAQEFDNQRALCASLRREINGQCPDGSYDPTLYNVVERI